MLHFVSVPLVYPHLQSTTIEPYEKSGDEPWSRVRTEKVEYKQQQQVTVKDSGPQHLVFEQRAAQTQRDVEDDWSDILDVNPKEAGTCKPRHKFKQAHIKKPIKRSIFHCVCISAFGISTSERRNC